ncbi:hypothetical protein A0H81_00176 [Grifola frondosa]|uniref:Uncharacterized protein n=1 Tax=Grifola frondosa TaxID=5627 RepID=A0A1C7MRD0_GRIFR|nr:hypothetical protein A0H81_00176 [Grifola frondosa]
MRSQHPTHRFTGVTSIKVPLFYLSSCFYWRNLGPDVLSSAQTASCSGSVKWPNRARDCIQLERHVFCAEYTPELERYFYRSTAGLSTDYFGAWWGGDLWALSHSALTNHSSPLVLRLTVLVFICMNVQGT